MFPSFKKTLADDQQMQAHTHTQYIDNETFIAHLLFFKLYTPPLNES